MVVLRRLQLITDANLSDGKLVQVSNVDLDNHKYAGSMNFSAGCVWLICWLCARDF